MIRPQEKGRLGEKAATKYLDSLGYKILETNFTSKYGEIDIIAKSKTTLIFIEVKNYKNNSLVTPYAAISKTKQHKIIKTAQYYCLKNNIKDIPSRFDVIILKDNRIVDYLEGAFFV